MEKGKKRTTATVIVMIVLAAFIIIFYYYWSNRTEPLSSSKKQSEEQLLINKDLKLYYPDTPREVVKLFAHMMKAIYGDQASEDEVKALALKIRELYDQELLNKNPEDTYLANLNSDLAKWKKEKRKITNYLMVRENKDEDSEIDGVKYATRYVSFTIQKNNKFSEVWKVLLRQDKDKKWKILGWKLAPEDESEVSAADGSED